MPIVVRLESSFMHHLFNNDELSKMIFKIGTPIEPNSANLCIACLRNSYVPLFLNYIDVY